MACRDVDLIISFYRNADLVEPVFNSLEQNHKELSAESVRVTAVNDSPDDPELKRVLDAAVERLSSLVPARVLQNESNLGFVRSVNRAARLAVDDRHDILLLNSDTILFPGAVAELKRIAYLDGMTGFVSPRSNNATICTLPHPPEFRQQSPHDAFENFKALSRFLPAYQYVPTAVGFCLYIRRLILSEFGYFDEAYGQGYNEENDLIMRANRAGFRAVIANHAFVYHIGESSFSSTTSPKAEREKTNAALLLDRYPEYASGVARYFDSPVYEAEGMLTALLPDSSGRYDLIFDFSSFGTYYNGTFEAAKRILTCATVSWTQHFNLHVMISDEALRFHELDRLKNVFFIPPDTDRVFAVAFRFGQPFEYRQLFRMSRMGVLNVYGMPDPIAFDCLHLHHANLELIWGTVFKYADAVMYVSDFSRDTFRNRFRAKQNLKEIVAYHSLDYRDYVGSMTDSALASDYILVIGNGFAHKRVPETVDKLSAAFPRQKIVALGLATHKARNVIAYPSGYLSNEQLRNLFAGSKFIVFPSLYEGFGIPVIEGLALGKPVLARSIPVMQDLRQRLNAEDRMILYESTADLIDILKMGFPTAPPVPRAPGDESASWAAVTCQIGTFFHDLIGDWSLSDDLLPRLEHMRLLREAVMSVNERAPLDVRVLGEPPIPNPVLREYDERVAAIYNSYSWRITAPLRKIMDLYLKISGKQAGS